MLNIVSIVIGALALLLAIPAFIPLLGWANWFVLPIAAFGAVVGTLSDKTTGRNLCLLVIAIAAIRLFLGSGIL